jgi:hypothetical protein
MSVITLILFVLLGFVGLVILSVSFVAPLPGIAVLFVGCWIVALMLHSTLPLPIILIFCLLAACRIVLFCIVSVYSFFAADGPRMTRKKREAYWTLHRTYWEQSRQASARIQAYQDEQRKLAKFTQASARAMAVCLIIGPRMEQTQTRFVYGLYDLSKRMEQTQTRFILDDLSKRL